MVASDSTGSPLSRDDTYHLYGRDTLFQNPDGFDKSKRFLGIPGIFFGVLSNKVDGISSSSARKTLVNSPLTVDFKGRIVIVVKGAETGRCVGACPLEARQVVQLDQCYDVNLV